MTTTDGIYFDGVRRVKGDCSGPRSAEAVLQHPLVEVAVLETARGGILRSGLAWDHSTVSVVLNVASDHLGLDGIETPEKLGPRQAGDYRERGQGRVRRAQRRGPT